MSALFLVVALGCSVLNHGHVVSQLESEVAALHDRNQLLWEQVGSCTVPDTPTAAYEELVQAFSGSDVRVRLSGLSVVVDVPPERVLLAQVPQLSTTSARVLDLIAVAVLAHPEVRVRVASTAQAPAAVYRKVAPTVWEMSALRAGVVVRSLADTYHVDPARLSAIGLGPRVQGASDLVIVLDPVPVVP